MVSRAFSDTPCARCESIVSALHLLASQGAHLNNLITRNLISTASLFAFASMVAAQNNQSLQQLGGEGSNLERSSGSSFNAFLSSARYDFGRGLTFSSADGENTMNVSGQVQVGYTWTEFNLDQAGAVGSNYTFGSSFSSDARLRVGGSVMDGKASYFLQMDPTGGGQDSDNLVDAWVGWHVADGINLRVGRQKMRSGLSADTSANDTDFETISRSSATNEFANLRATGAMLEGAGMEGRFNWHLGVANSGTAANTASQILFLAPAASQANDDTDMMVTAGLSFGSHAGNSEDWSEGDLAHSGEMQWIAGATVTVNNGAVDDTQTINAFGGFKFGNGFATQVEYWTRDFDNADLTDDGGYVQLSYTMAKSGSMQPGFVARFGTVNFENNPDVEGPEFVIGANAYFAEHNLKWQLQYASGTVENFAADDIESSSIGLLCTVVF